MAVPKLLDRYADESYKLLSQVKVEPPTPEEAERIRKKCVRWVIPYICLGYHLMYVDKQTVSDYTTNLSRRPNTNNLADKNQQICAAWQLFHSRYN